eukprot:2845662-Prymnesium_polylepis.1
MGWACRCAADTPPRSHVGPPVTWAHPPVTWQLTLIEHVAHLTAADYDKVPSDLVKLGFVPEGAEQ